MHWSSQRIIGFVPRQCWGHFFHSERPRHWPTLRWLQSTEMKPQSLYDGRNLRPEREALLAANHRLGAHKSSPGRLVPQYSFELKHQIEQIDQLFGAREVKRPPVWGGQVSGLWPSTKSFMSGFIPYHRHEIFILRCRRQPYLHRYSAAPSAPPRVVPRRCRGR